MEKIKFVVIEECALAYVAPERPQTGYVLAAHVSKGALAIKDGDAIHLATNPHRPARRDDFAIFRVCSAGYATGVEYEFPSE